MRNRITLSLFAFVLLALAIAGAQDLTIDDFTTGPSNILMYQSGTTNVSKQTGDPNHLIGGLRYTNVNAKGNTLNQVSTFQFRPDVKNNQSAFIHNGAFYASPRVDMGYGWGAVMHVDLGSYRNDSKGLIRVNFKGLAENLNFNIQLFTGTKWAQGGCNIAAYPGAFSVELPLDKFADTGINFADVTYVNFIFQSSSAIGAVNFAVSSIQVSKTPHTGAIPCHY
jgi:hypothetical protein